MAHNNNVGKITSNNIAIKGSGTLSTTSDKGSILGLRYIKDNKLGTGAVTTTPQNVDSVSLKNWFATYVTTRGKFQRTQDQNTNIKFSEYSGATILGFKVRAVNETAYKYKTKNDAGLQVTPLNGSGPSGGGGETFQVKVGGLTTNSNGEEVTMGRSAPNFDGNSGSQVVVITDLVTNIPIRMTWTPGYADNASMMTGSDSVAGPGAGFSFVWPSGGNSTTYSDYLFFFMGIQDTRLYGSLY